MPLTTTLTLRLMTLYSQHREKALTKKAILRLLRQPFLSEGEEHAQVNKITSQLNA